MRADISRRTVGERRRVLLVTSHGYAVRNFLLHGTLARLAATCDVVVASPWGPALPELTGGPPLDHLADFVQLPEVQERPVSRLLRQVLNFAHLRVHGWHGMKVMLRDERLRRRNLPQGRRWLDRVSDLAARMIRTPTMLRRVSLLLQKGYDKSSGTNSAWFSFLDRIAPATVLSCDQRYEGNLPLVAAAEQLGVPTAAFIFSWDNLSSKQRIPAYHDRYFVWSRHMAQELRRLYPEIPEESVEITGTPQFAPYWDQSLQLDREEFFAQIDCDPKRPLLCFAGEDPRTDPENAAHLREVCALIEKRDIPGEPQLLLRPAPGHQPELWGQVLADHPWVRFCPPQWSKDETTSTWLPTHADTIFLANLVRHASCCVNIVSTMTLDFALRGKPTVNIAYDLADPPPRKPSLFDSLFRFDHFVPVVELGASQIARSRMELCSAITACLQGPDTTQIGRQEFIALETDGLSPTAPQLLAQAVISMAQ